MDTLDWMPNNPSDNGTPMEAPSPHDATADVRTSHARHLPSRPPADFYLMVAGIVAVLAVVVPTALDGYDNDIWFILASGREIAERGFPTINPWAVYDGMRVVIQQWVPDVLAFFSYSLWGWRGLTALLLLACGVLALALYRLGRVCSPKARPETIVACSALALIGFRAYISYRPQIYTMILMCLTLTVMERYRRRGSARELLWLAPIEVAHANFHASMAVVDIAIVAAYAVPNLRGLWDGAREWLARRARPTDADGRPLLGKAALARKAWDLSDASYPRLPLLVAMALMALLTLLNPYRLDGALYLVRSIGAADYGNYIEEMKALMPTTAQFGIVFLAVWACSLILIGGRGTRGIDLPVSACAIVLGYLGFEHVRNVWLIVPFAFVLLLKAVHRLPLLPSRLVAPTRGLRAAVLVLAAVMVAFICWAGAQGHLESPESDTANTPVIGVDAIDALVPEEQRSSTGVFCTFEAGGYLEWRGYQVSMDARPELWEPGITGAEEHHYQDYVDMMSDSLGVADVLEQADCPFVIANSSSVVNTYLRGSSDYESVLVRGSYQVWRHR